MKRTKELLAVLKGLKLITDNDYAFGCKDGFLFHIQSKIDELETELRVTKFLTDVCMLRYPCSFGLELNDIDLFLLYATKAQIAKIENKFALTFKEKLNSRELEAYIDEVVQTYFDKRDIG